MNKDLNISDCQLMFGDCLERMKEIPDRSIDMILCDLP
jgi:DNA modification methylase